MTCRQNHLSPAQNDGQTNTPKQAELAKQSEMDQQTEKAKQTEMLRLTQRQEQAKTDPQSVRNEQKEPMELQPLLQQAKMKDLALLMEWRKRVLEEVFAQSEVPDWNALMEENRLYYQRHLADGSHYALFARHPQTHEILGVGALCLYQEMPSPDNPSGICGYLMNIYTLPQWRHHHVANAVVKALIQKAQECQAQKIYLETSEAGRRLYEQLGFANMHDYLKLGSG